MEIAMMGYYPNFNHNNLTSLNFGDTRSILEYDMLIIDFSNLFDEYEFYGQYNGIDRLTQSDSQKIKNDIERRKIEFKEFLKSGRNILVISPYREVKIRYTGEHSVSGTGRNAKTTNYIEEVALTDSLPIKFNSVQCTGKTIENCDDRTNNIFQKYKQNLKYDSYLNREDCSNPLLQISRTSKIVANYEKYENGIILFFPNHVFNDSKKEREFFKNIFDLMNDLNNNKIRELPNWINKYNTEDEKKVKKELSDLEEKIKILNNKIQKINKKITSMNEEKRIFIESGERLEIIVRDIFRKIGYKIVKFGGNEEDLVISDDNNTFVFEIKGLDSSAAEKNSAQAVKWTTNYFIDTGIKAKSVLVINAYKNMELKDRKDTFPNQMLKYSEYQQICLMDSIQLYNIYNKFLNKEISIKEISEIIMNTNGIMQEFKNWKMFLEN